MVINGQPAYKCSRVTYVNITSLSKFSCRRSSKYFRSLVAMLLLPPSFLVRISAKNVMMKITKRKDAMLVVEAMSCIDV